MKLSKLRIENVFIILFLKKRQSREGQQNAIRLIPLTAFIANDG